LRAPGGDAGALITRASSASGLDKGAASIDSVKEMERVRAEFRAS
jgi:hypothetical protein